MLARVHCGSLLGVEAEPVDVEVHLGKGLPAIDIVGLPEAAVRESRVRVRAAMAHAGFEMPLKNIVLNLAPGDLRKSGSGFDLPIAVSLLTAAGVCAPNELDDTWIVGELSLSGELRAVRGILAHLRTAAASGVRQAIVPIGNAAEASLARGIEVRCASTLQEVIAFLNGAGSLPSPEAPPSASAVATLDLRDVYGQQSGKRALEIAAAGAHHILFVGPPGSGKTMLAQRLSGILPLPTDEEALEIATIAGVEGRVGSFGARPFRSPHHSMSDAAMVGGGDPIRPGEVTLAHGGVLFLDELPELRRPVVEALRITMELGVAVVARVRTKVAMPAAPLIVGAMNPCPCGFAGDPRCRCSPKRVEAYAGRISGPILDRFDLHVALTAVDVRTLRHASDAESSAGVRERVVAARAFATSRGETAPRQVRQLATSCKPSALALLDGACTRFGMSARGYTKVLRVARTIADLAASELVTEVHVAEALQYRVLDRRRAPRTD